MKGECKELCEGIIYVPTVVYCTKEYCNHQSKNKIPFVWNGKAGGRMYECTKFHHGEVEQQQRFNKLRRRIEDH